MSWQELICHYRGHRWVSYGWGWTHTPVKCSRCGVDR